MVVSGMTRCKVKRATIPTYLLRVQAKNTVIDTTPLRAPRQDTIAGFGHMPERCNSHADQYHLYLSVNNPGRHDDKLTLQHWLLLGCYNRAIGIADDPATVGMCGAQRISHAQRECGLPCWHSNDDIIYGLAEMTHNSGEARYP